MNRHNESVHKDTRRELIEYKEFFKDSTTNIGLEEHENLQRIEKAVNDLGLFRMVLDLGSLFITYNKEYPSILTRALCIIRQQDQTLRSQASLLKHQTLVINEKNSEIESLKQEINNKVSKFFLV